VDRVLEARPKEPHHPGRERRGGPKVAELADAAGLLYSPDPGSMKISTIGGNVAENSGGLRGTRDYVMGLARPGVIGLREFGPVGESVASPKALEINTEAFHPQPNLPFGQAQVARHWPCCPRTPRVQPRSSPLRPCTAKRI
jgi:hypothetical protein